MAKTLLSIAPLVAFLAGCPSGKATIRSNPDPRPPATDKLDAALGAVSAVAQFLVRAGDGIECSKYSGSEAITKVVAAKSDAELQLRAASAESLASWRTTNDAAISAAIDAVAVPIRKTKDCAALTSDRAWETVSETLVMLALPPDFPQPVQQRRKVTEALVARGAEITDPSKCQEYAQQATAAMSELEPQLKAMTRVQRFLDAVVWSKAEKEAFKQDARTAKFAAVCAEKE